VGALPGSRFAENPSEFKDLILNFLSSHPVARLAFPLLLLAASLWACFNSVVFAPAWRLLLTEALPFVSIAVAMLLSIRFNRSRYSLLLALVAIAGLSQTWLRGQLLPATESLLFAVLIGNAFWLGFGRDRSLFSIHGLWRIGLLSAQFAAIYYLATHAGDRAKILLEPEWFDLPEWLALFVQLPDAIFAGAVLVCLAHMVLSLTRNSSVQATFFGAQLVLLGIASGYPHADFVPLLLGSCGLMVALAIVMDSYDMAYRDELTGIASRRALNQLLQSLGRRYTIAMLDIDHFKQFNDAHGHDIGDEVLRMVATKIARVGAGGKAFRYGGEEFTIVFPGKQPEQAQAELEALREAIEQYIMVVRRKPRRSSAGGKRERARRGKNDPRYQSLSVTISIGYAARDGEHRSPESVVKAADQALYRAKKKGRNRVSH
jgi:diguanylate cyclase (GGDEF)-like protein